MQLQKVSDPALAATDPVLLAVLAGQGVDKDGVALVHDYAPRALGKRFSPYSKLYRDLNSDRQFLVFSGLPMCDAYGQAHELAWRDKDGIIENGNNIFHALISAGDVRLAALSDQPDGTLKNEEVLFHPRLFIGGGEVLPVSPRPSLLESDPDNPGYANNVLEWDYGVCRRRLRLIEGRLLGSWVFTGVPREDVLIRYNQQGRIRLKLRFARTPDEEYLPADYFTGCDLPVTVADSATFYPDANPESSSVDGYCSHSTGGYGTGIVWSALVAAAGSSSEDTANNFIAVGMNADNVTPKWRTLHRGIQLFNTSSLPDDAVVSAAALSIYGYGKSDSLAAAPTTNIYASSPASNTALAPGDFDSLGAAPFCDTPIPYASWSTAGYNDFALNAAGIAAIAATGVTKFGTRNANYDVTAVMPPWVSTGNSYVQGYTAEKGSGYKPKLVVTYTSGTAVVSGDTGTGSEASSVASGELKTSLDGGAGSEAIALRETGAAETGAGVEAAAAGKEVPSADGGAGAETSSLAKAVFGGDAAAGADALKALSTRSGAGLKLRDHFSRIGLPHKEVKK